MAETLERFREAIKERGGEIPPEPASEIVPAGKKKLAGEIVKIEDERKIVALRKRGYSFDQIGRAVGMTQSGAFKAFRRALKRVVRSMSVDISEIRALETIRLDDLTKHLTDQIENKSNPPEIIQGAIGLLLKVIDRRAAYWHLDKQQPATREDERTEAERSFGAAIKGATDAELAEFRRIANDIAERSKKPGGAADAKA